MKFPPLVKCDGHTNGCRARIEPGRAWCNSCRERRANKLRRAPASPADRDGITRRETDRPRLGPGGVGASGPTTSVQVERKE